MAAPAPKIRGVKPEFWTDESMVALSMAARLLFIGLWNWCCDNGHTQDKPRQIKMRVFPADNVDIDELLTELVDENCIERAGGTITVLNFTKHQKPHKSWWKTCDLPHCTLPPDAKAHPERTRTPATGNDHGSNRGATVDNPPTPAIPRSSTVEQPLHNSGATVAHGCATDDVDIDIDSEGGSGGAASPTPAPRNGRKRPTRAIPEDWRPNHKHAEYARERGIDLSSEAFRFRNHAHSVDRRLVDWDAGFRNWLTKARPERPVRSATDKRPEGW